MPINKQCEEKRSLTCSAGGDGDDGEALAGRHHLLSSASSSAFLCFCVHRLLSFSSSFWDDEDTGWIYFDWFLGCSFSAGTKTMVVPLLFSPLLCVYFLLCFCSGSTSVFWFGFRSPRSDFWPSLYRDQTACPSTSPASAGLLFNPRMRSWARDVVHDRIWIAVVFPVE